MKTSKNKMKERRKKQSENEVEVSLPSVKTKNLKRKKIALELKKKKIIRTNPALQDNMVEELSENEAEVPVQSPVIKNMKRKKFNLESRKKTIQKNPQRQESEEEEMSENEAEVSLSSVETKKMKRKKFKLESRKKTIQKNPQRQESEEEEMVITSENEAEVSLSSVETKKMKHNKVNSESNEGQVIRIKPKRRHAEKKRMVAELTKLQEIMKANVAPDEEELELERHVFGGSVEAFVKEHHEETFEKEHQDETSDEDKVTSDVETDNKTELKPAWEDEDDETTLVKEKAETFRQCHRSVSVRGDEKYSNFAQEKFTKIMGAPKWAELNNNEKMSDDESEDELLQKTGNFITQSESLPKGNINAVKCTSLVDASMKATLIKSVKFHPRSRVAMVATSNGTANLFQVDGKINAKIQSIHFDDFPIQAAHFSADGEQIFVGSSRHSHFFSYDMYEGKTSKIPWQRGMQQTSVRRFHLSPDGRFIVVHGRFGNIHLMTYKSREWIGTLKMNGEVNAITFNSDGSKMYSHGENREVYIWDMSTRRCVHKFVDEGCVTGTALSLSPNDQFLAAGSDSGVVNIYDNRSLLATSSPQPIKALMNLTTEVTSLKFNNSSELLCMASCHKPDAVKLVHFPSLTVYSNFPPKGDRHNLKHPNSIDISTNSGFLCIGNNVGTAHMYRLKHFKNY